MKRARRFDPRSRSSPGRSTCPISETPGRFLIVWRIERRRPWRIARAPRRIEKQRRIEALRTKSAHRIAGGAAGGADRRSKRKSSAAWCWPGRAGLRPGPPGIQPRVSSVSADHRLLRSSRRRRKLPRARDQLWSLGGRSFGRSFDGRLFREQRHRPSMSACSTESRSIRPSLTARVGPGVDFDRLNAALDSAGLHVPSGACGAVCVAGFMQGGGFGYTSRDFGMNCDNVVEVVVMLWNGATVRANERQNQDLFWALRGGTGGNFGIVLEVAYQAAAPGGGLGVRHPVGRLAGRRRSAGASAKLHAGRSAAGVRLHDERRLPTATLRWRSFRAYFAEPPPTADRPLRR